jgi:hypothetical protein
VFVTTRYSYANERAEGAEAERAMWKNQVDQQIPLSIAGCRAMVGDSHNSSDKTVCLPGAIYCIGFPMSIPDCLVQSQPDGSVATRNG